MRWIKSLFLCNFASLSTVGEDVAPLPLFPTGFWAPTPFLLQIINNNSRLQSLGQPQHCMAEFSFRFFFFSEVSPHIPRILGLVCPTKRFRRFLFPWERGILHSHISHMKLISSLSKKLILFCFQKKTLSYQTTKQWLHSKSNNFPLYC